MAEHLLHLAEAVAEEAAGLPLLPEAVEEVAAELPLPPEAVVVAAEYQLSAANLLSVAQTRLFEALLPVVQLYLPPIFSFFLRSLLAIDHPSVSLALPLLPAVLCHLAVAAEAAFY